MMKKYLLAFAAVLTFNISARAEEQATVVQTPVVDQEFEEVVNQALENAKTPEEKIEILNNLSKEIQKENPVLFAGLTQEQKKTYAKYILYSIAAVAVSYMAYCTYRYWRINTKPAEAKPSEAKPAEEKPAEEKPAEEKPAEEKPAEEKPAEEKPSEEKPSEADKKV